MSLIPSSPRCLTHTTSDDRSKTCFFNQCTGHPSSISIYQMLQIYSYTRPPRIKAAFFLFAVINLGKMAAATSAPFTHHRFGVAFPYHHLQAMPTEEEISITKDYDPYDGYDVGGPAPICWRTVNSVTTRSPSCPPSAILTFTDPPPDPMYSMRDYVSHFRITANEEDLNLLSLIRGTTGERYTLWHANIHSCVASVGFCTPSISNTPGLATHSPEKVTCFVLFYVIFEEGT